MAQLAPLTIVNCMHTFRLILLLFNRSMFIGQNQLQRHKQLLIDQAKKGTELTTMQITNAAGDPIKANAQLQYKSWPQ